MEFGEWEVDDDIFAGMSEEGEVQESLPMRRATLHSAPMEPPPRRVATDAPSAEDGAPEGARADEETARDTQMGNATGTTSAVPVGNEDDTPNEEVLLLVDAANGFNNLSRYGMLWTVKHRCSKMARFSFNCYRHEIRLICRRPGEDAVILLSKEGVTQGDPLAMALYGIALLPLAEILREANTEVLQPWYADDAAMQGRALAVAQCFHLLIRVGPHFGYFPEPEKSFAICPLATEAAAKEIFEREGLPVRYCRGHRYVGGYVGSTAMQDRWIEPMVGKWVASIEALARVARKYPQSAYAGYSQSLQAEMQYICRVVPGVGKHLEPVEMAIREYLIPALFELEPGELKTDFRILLEHGVKQGGMNLKNPAKGAERLLQASTEASEVLVASLLDATTLDSEAHKACVRQAGAKARKERVDGEKEVVRGMMALASKAVKKRLERIGQTGAWLTMIPNRLNNTLLSMEEWRDNARLRYGLRPVGLCAHCDGCGAHFTIEHGLNCKKGGLVGIRHDDTRDEAGGLAAMALTLSKVSYEPQIFYGRDVAAGQPNNTQNNGSYAIGDEARGNVKVHGLWDKGSDCILDIQVTDTDARSYQSISSEKVLERAAKVKKSKYLEACLERQRSFMPLVYSVDGMA